MYTFEQIRTFVKVAETGSFNKAALSEYTAASAVMKKIDILESELGVKLFVRTPKGQILTSAGKSFYEDSKRIIEMCLESAERAVFAGQEDARSIRVGTSIIAPIEPMSSIFAEVQSRHSEIKLEIVSLECSESIFGKVGEKADILVAPYDSLTQKLGKYETLELERVPVCAAMSLNHRLAGRKSIDFEDLHGEHILTIHGGLSGIVDEFREFTAQNHREITIEEVDDYSIEIFNECAGGNKIFMTVGEYNQSHIFLKRVPINWDTLSPFGILYPRNPSGAIKNFLTAVKEIVSETRNEEAAHENL